MGKNAFIQLTLVNPAQLFWPPIDEISVLGDDTAGLPTDWPTVLQDAAKTDRRDLLESSLVDVVLWEEEDRNGTR